MQQEKEKTWLTVLAEIDQTGLMEPRIILWPDGRRFKIDEVISWRKAQSQGPRTTCYVVRIKGQRRTLYFTQAVNCSIVNMGRWFVESAM